MRRFVENFGQPFQKCPWNFIVSPSGYTLHICRRGAPKSGSGIKYLKRFRLKIWEKFQEIFSFFELEAKTSSDRSPGPDFCLENDQFRPWQTKVPHNLNHFDFRTIGLRPFESRPNLKFQNFLFSNEKKFKFFQTD